MPELPEVETIRAGLEPYLRHRRIESIEVLHPRTSRRQDGGAAGLAAAVAGTRIEAVARRGKFLWFELSDDTALLAHLGMSGQFRCFDTPADPPHERARIVLSGDGASTVLSFCDQRTFGYLAHTDLVPSSDGGPGGRGTSRPALPAPVNHIARDLLDPMTDVAVLARRLAGRERGIKHLLLDQSLVAGIGNIYADEALWRAGSHGLVPASRLGARRIEALLGHARDVMTEALAAGGTSFDPLYVNVNGSSGYFSRELAVYGREGEECLRCGAAIRRERFAGRSSHCCPRCQPPPRPRRGSGGRSDRSVSR